MLAQSGTVLDEKQLRAKFIETQIRANHVIHIHRGDHKDIPSAGKFTYLLRNSPCNYLALLWAVASVSTAVLEASRVRVAAAHNERYP